jgi:hypothetical protein
MIKFSKSLIPIILIPLCLSCTIQPNTSVVKPAAAPTAKPGPNTAPAVNSPVSGNTATTTATGTDDSTGAVKDQVEGSITIKGLVTEFVVVGNMRVRIPVVGVRLEMAGKETFSDQSGNYSLGEIPFGVYNLKVEKDGYDNINDPTYSVHSNIGHLDFVLLKLK